MLSLHFEHYVFLRIFEQKTTSVFCQIALPNICAFAQRGRIGIMNRKLLIWLLILVVAFSSVGCGSKSTNSTAAFSEQYSLSEPNVAVEQADKESEYGGTASETNNLAEKKDASGQSLANMSSLSQKIIFSGQVNLQTLNFEKTKTDLYQYITSIGGFTQNSSVQGGGIGYSGLKSAEYVFRIPKAKYNQSLIDLRKFGTVVLEQSSGEDVTEQYFDTEARLKSLKIQQERLQELLKKAVKMEDILKIEKELQVTLYEIENYTGTLRKWDSLVEYSTLSVNISEVEQIKPITPKEKDGFFQRIAFSFKNSLVGMGEFLQDLVVALAAALPVIIPLGLIGYLIYRVMRKKIRKIEKNDNNEKIKKDTEE